MGGRTVPSSMTNGYAKAYAVNATDSSFATRADTTTEPAEGSGVISLFTGLDRVGPTWVSLLFFGTGDANDVFLAKVYGIRRVGASWTHVPLLSLTVTLGAKTGVAGGGVGAAELYADTLVVASPSYGVADGSYRLISPADDTVARLLLDTEGFEKLRIDVDDSTGNPTGMNALLAGV
jgi:hypothetical protein